MIYKFSNFWSYIGNEPQWIIDDIKDKLTILEKDMQTEEVKSCVLYQIHSNILGCETLKIPTGLCDWLSNHFHLEIEYVGRKYDYTSNIKNQVFKVFDDIKENHSEFEIRDYQVQGAAEALSSLHGTLHFGVGTGKTSILGIIVKFLNNDKVLILNNSDFILNQIYNRLIYLGIDKDDISTGLEDLNKRIQIVSTQTLNNRLDLPLIQEYLKTVNVMIYDEAQHCQAITFFKPLFYCDYDNLKHIIGFSGSLYRDPKFKYSNFKDIVTVAVLGEPVMYYEMKDSIEEKTIAQPHAYFINYEDKELDLKRFPFLRKNYFQQYRFAITNNYNRNKAGIAMLKYLNEHNITTLALVKEIKHGQKLQLALKQLGIKSMFICGNETIYEYGEKTNRKGEPKLEKRNGNMDDIKKALDDGYKIIFGSSVLNEGVDCPSFEAGVLFIAGVSPISLIQQTGRVSRKKDGLNISLVIDFKDHKSHYIFSNQYIKRKQTLIENGVKICNNVYDFFDIVDKIENSKRN